MRYYSPTDRDTAYAMLDVLVRRAGSGPLPSRVMKEEIDWIGWRGTQQFASADSDYIAQARKYLRDHGVPLVVTRMGPLSTYSIEELTIGGEFSETLERYEKDLYSAAVSLYRSLSGARGKGKQLLRSRVYQAVLAVGLDFGMTQEDVDADLKGKQMDAELVAIIDSYRTNGARS
jgi:hypothetical protein